MLTVDFPTWQNELPRFIALLFHSWLLPRETLNSSEHPVEIISSPVYCNRSCNFWYASKCALVFFVFDFTVEIYLLHYLLPQAPASEQRQTSGGSIQPLRACHLSALKPSLYDRLARASKAFLTIILFRIPWKNNNRKIKKHRIKWEIYPDWFWGTVLHLQKIYQLLSGACTVRTLINLS